MEENYENVEKRSWPYLEKKFGKKDFDNMRDFAISRYIRNVRIGEGKNKSFACEIELEGLELLERYDERKIQRDLNRRLLDATIIIALAGALGVFVSLWNLILASGNSLSKVWGLLVIGIVLIFLAGVLAERVFSLLNSRKNDTNKT